jgi:hypothetical protein
MLQVSERGVVTVDMKSAEFDAYLILTNLNRVPLAENDDLASDVLDSRLTIHLPAGNYWLLATEIGGGRGAFTVETKTEAPRPCDAPTLSFQTPAEGAMREAGCRVLDAVQLSTDTRVATPYSFALDGKQVFRGSADVTGAASGSFYLADRNGRLIFRRVLDAAGASDMEMLLNPGGYQVLLAANAPQTPTHTVRGSVRTPPVCPLDEVGLNATVAGALAPQDCQVLEMLAEAPISTPARQYRLNLTGSGRLTTTLSTGELEPVLLLVDSQDRAVGLNLATSPGAVSLTSNLSAGSYRVLVSTLRNGGAFNVKTEWQPSGIVTPPIGEDEPEAAAEPSPWITELMRRLQGGTIELDRAASPKLRREE